tara:strand:+ start:839 stop:1129 length:291 start_codon:yes stop_codon:yes gene_type:complete
MGRKKTHPMQPLILTENGIIRFKVNKIVRFLLDNGGIDLNKLELMDFSNEDREQFAQLIGYSFFGFCNLGYVSDATYSKGEKMERVLIKKIEKRSK